MSDLVRYGVVADDKPGVLTLGGVTTVIERTRTVPVLRLVLTEIDPPAAAHVSRRPRRPAGGASTKVPARG